MENYTSVEYIKMLPFLSRAQDKPIIFSLFLLIYLVGMLMNTVIVTVIYCDEHLHTPMYLFLSNLSVVDMCYTTTVIPKLLCMLVSKYNAVSFLQCFTQMYFFFIAASAEDILLFIMAYDRFVAICIPLHYHSILNTRVCVLIVVGVWVLSLINAFLITLPASVMSFCHSNTIHHFYCDAKALSTISCSGKEVFNLVMCIQLLLLGLVPFACSLVSYIKITLVILQIKTKEGRSKAFSTCSSHLSVILLYYTTGVSVYMMPPSKYSIILEQICTVLYATVTPMLNPLIYSLRNKEVRRALQRLISVCDEPETDQSDAKLRS